MRRMTKPWHLALFGGLFFVVGLLFFQALLRAAIASPMFSKWDRADATVVLTEVSWDWPDKAAPEQVIEIEYEYEVGGKIFRSNRAAFIGKTIRKDVPKSFATLKRGDSIRIWFDPGSPDQSIAYYNGASSTFYVILVLSIICMAIGI